MSSSLSLSRSTRLTLLLAVLILTVAGGLLVVGLAGKFADDAAIKNTMLALALFAAVLALIGALALTRELGKRRDAELAALASEAKFSGILAIAVDAIITMDEQQRIIHFNNGAEQLFGWSAGEMIGQSLDLLLPPRFRNAHGQHVRHFGHGEQASRRMGERRAIFGLRSDGTEFPAEASISRLDLPDGRLFTVVMRDMTSRLKIEENERFLGRAGALLAQSLDHESTLRSVVHLAIPHLADCCILDISESPAVVRRIVSVHDDPDRTRRLRALESRRVDVTDWPFPIREVLAGGNPVVRRNLGPGWERHEGADESHADDVAALGVHSMLAIPLVARDRVIGVLTLLATDPQREFGDVECEIAGDLANRAAFAIDNAWLYQAAQQASRARDEILGVVSHDLRNPLSAISMCARVLLESPPSQDSERRDLAQAILESTQLMQRLIQDLLDVSTIESGHLRIYQRPEFLSPIVDSVLNMVRQHAEERGVLLQRDVALDLPSIHVDSMRVEQVLANIVSNAVKFTEPGGRVTVRASASAAWVTVRVTDTGVGIPADHLPRIFDRYWHARRQSRTVGTGLGLAIARGIVEAHGGAIHVESTPGVGTTFIFTLPVVDAARTPPRDGAAELPTVASRG